MAADASVRRSSWAALGSWALLAAMQLGWPLAQQWAFNLWAYLPPGAGALFGAASLALVSARVREALAAGARRSVRSAESAPAFARGALLFAAVTLGLWILRERHLFGDSLILVATQFPPHRYEFVFPDTGATFLIARAIRFGLWLGVGGEAGVRAAACLCGGVCALLLVPLARRLAPGHAPAAGLFLVSGGVLRLFAGHIEVYAYQWVGVLAYLVAALAYLEGRAPWWLACVALGSAIWLHGVGVLMLPSLVALHVLREPGLAASERLRRAGPGLLLVAVPLLLFLLAELAAGHREDLARMVERFLEIAGLRTHEPGLVRWWVRGWGSYESIGTDVVFLSRAHLKYLANAFYLLAPGTVPLLVALALRAPRSLAATPTARFLLAAALPLVVYAGVDRPFWGPYDWDLFSIPVLCLSCLAVHALCLRLSRRALGHLFAWVVGFQLAFVGVPFLLAGALEVRPAGPFFPRGPLVDLPRAATPPPDDLAPWL